MSAAESQSLLQEYSSIFAELQAGKRAFIDYGADRVILNRYIIDAAVDTSDVDDQSVLDTVNLEKVEDGESAAERLQHCRKVLAQLVVLQEEVNTLQRVAKERGISSGLLSIVGQAANQSPDDHGASVIRQLHYLLNEEETTAPVAAAVKTTDSLSTDEQAANDSASRELERLTELQKLQRALLMHWRPIAVDCLVCLVATCFAITLVG